MRAPEKPLSNGGKWTQWAWVPSAGEIREGGTGKFWRNTAIGKTEGARWNVAEFNRPLVSVKWIVEVAGELALNACFAAAAQSGYTARFIKGEPNVLYLEKWVAGVKTILGKVEFIAIGGGVNQFALTVVGGKLRVWTKFEEEGWQLWLAVADATYTKGYSGFEAEWQLQNFTTGEVTEETAVWRLFNGTTDAGTLIEAHWKSAWFPLQEGESRERIRRMDIQLQGDAILSVFTDFEQLPRFQGPVPKLGELKEFDEPSGEGLAYRFVRVRPETYGRYHQVELKSNSSGVPFQVNSMEIVYRGGKQH
jgi:hypothetical protein